MKTFSILLAILALCLAVAATDVSGDQSGIWSPTNNPYNLVGDVTVPTGSSLVILPGVEVYAMGNYRITAQGFIHAAGSPADSIRFMSGQADPNALWKGIRLENTSSLSTFSRCYIEKAEYGINSINSPVDIHLSRFHRNQKGMQLYGIGSANPATALVEHNLIEYSIENGILVAQNSNATITNNEIRFNGTGAQYRGAIQLSNQSAGGSCSPLIQYNHIHHNFKQGITAWDIVGANAILTHILDNLIEYNLTGIYFLNASGYVADNIIRHNFIPGDANSGAGVMVAGATSEPYFERNQIYGNFTGFYIGNNAQPCLGNLLIYHAWAQGENNIHDNYDESGTLHSVYCYSYTNPNIVIMAENNYWGANTAAEIGIGINDQLDDPALPLVDFDPWLTSILPTSIVGSVHYDGLQTLVNPRLQIVSVAEGTVLHETPCVLNAPFGLALPIDEFFHVVALAEVSGQNITLYGTPGGLLDPTSYAPGDFVPVDTGTIMIVDTPPPRRETVGAPVQEDGLTLHPVYHKFFVYAIDHANWFYDEGDWRYIRRHKRWTSGGELEFDLPLGTVWTKIGYLLPNDSWTRTEIIDDAGTQRITTIHYTYIQDMFITNRAEGCLFRQSSPQEGMISQRLDEYNEQWLFHYQDNWLARQEAVMETEGFPSLQAWAHCIYEPVIPSFDPGYLGFADLALQGDLEFTLYWQAPQYDGTHTWTTYRIYRDDQLFAIVPFSETTCHLDNLYSWDTYNLRVCASDGVNESGFSNWVHISGVASDDLMALPPVLNIFPNPARPSSGTGICFHLQSSKALRGSITIYNLRGQQVRSIPVVSEGSISHTWDGCDQSGSPASAGIYFVRTSLEGENPLQKKLILLK